MSGSSQSLNAGDGEFVRELIRRRSAIIVDSTKDYLLESRLGRLADQQGLRSIAELIRRVRSGVPDLETKLVEAMTTHETFFFRDGRPFDLLRSELVPSLLAARKESRAITFWSAACSTGQEAYSLAILLREGFPELSGWKVRIVGTDLSEQVVTQAREGCFRQVDVNRGLPASLLVKYFERAGTRWQIDRSIRDMVQFSQLNLLDAWPATLQPDVIFLRNVLIYFDLETKRTILARARQAIAPDGALLLGAAETTLNIDDQWQRVAHETATYYRPGRRTP